MNMDDKIPPIPQTLEINGIGISGERIPQLIAMVTNPDPDRWFRFWRIAGENGLPDTIHVESRYDSKAEL